MESLIGLVNRIQRACTVLGDYGGDSALPTLWESLPSVVVVGGQVFVFFLLCIYDSICLYYACMSFILVGLRMWNLFMCWCLIFYWFVRVEFWKVFRLGEHCRSRFSSQGFRLGFLKRGLCEFLLVLCLVGEKIEWGKWCRKENVCVLCLFHFSKIEKKRYIMSTFYISEWNLKKKKCSIELFYFP